MGLAVRLGEAQLVKLVTPFLLENVLGYGPAHTGLLSIARPLAFSIAASPTDDSGKTPGTDLREGVHTLPVLYALAADGPDAVELRALLVDDQTGKPRPLHDDDEVARALELLRTSAGMAAARDKLGEYLAAAREDLAHLPASPARDALADLAAYTVERTG